MNAGETGKLEKSAGEPVAFVDSITFALSLPHDVLSPYADMQAVCNFPPNNSVTQDYHHNRNAGSHRRPQQGPQTGDERYYPRHSRGIKQDIQNSCSAVVDDHEPCFGFYNIHYFTHVENAF